MRRYCPIDVFINLFMLLFCVIAVNNAYNFLVAVSLSCPKQMGLCIYLFIELSVGHKLRLDCSGLLCVKSLESSADSADTGLGSFRSFEDETCGWSEDVSS